MVSQKALFVGMTAVFALIGAALLAVLAWQWQKPAGHPHEIFGSSDFLRMAMPASKRRMAEEPDPALALLESEMDGSEEAELSEEGEEAAIAERDSATPASTEPLRPRQQASFAERFGSLSREVRNPTWLDVSFDLAQAGRSDPGTGVAKQVTYDGNALGELDLEFGGGSTVLVNPKQLLALLQGASVDTASLQSLAGKDMVAFAELRSAGIDLRYRPVQDQLSLQVVQNR